MEERANASFTLHVWPPLTPRVWSAEPPRTEERKEFGETGRAAVRRAEDVALINGSGPETELPYRTPVENGKEGSVHRLKPDIFVHTGSRPSLGLDPGLRT